MSIHEEQMLIDYTMQLKQQYLDLSRIVESIEGDSSQSVESISDQMNLIKQTESLLGPLREAYQRKNEHASGRVQEVTDETIEVVKSLMPKLANLEKASVDSLRRLFPKIQGSVRAVQMQNAYKGNHHP